MTKHPVQAVTFTSKEDIEKYLNDRGRDNNGSYVATIEYRLSTGNFNTVYIRTNSGNCKSAFVSNIGSALAGSDASSQKVLDTLEVFFKRIMSKLVFTTTLINKQSLTRLQGRFPLAYCIEVPIGYGTGVQYHCGFFTNNNNYGGYDGYLRRVKGDGSKVITPKKAVVITKEIRDKILAYKQKHWLEKYLNKLIS